MLKKWNIWYSCWLRFWMLDPQTIMTIWKSFISPPSFVEGRFVRKKTTTHLGFQGLVLVVDTCLELPLKLFLCSSNHLPNEIQWLKAMPSNHILSKFLSKNPNLKSWFPRLVLQTNKNPRFFQTSRYLVNQLGVGVIAAYPLFEGEWIVETLGQRDSIDSLCWHRQWVVGVSSAAVISFCPGCFWFGYVENSGGGGGVFVEVIFNGILPSLWDYHMI